MQRDVYKRQAYVTVSIIIVVLSILLTLVVLIQNSKGGGLAANFAAGNQAFGVRQTADFLEKITWGLAASILVPVSYTHLPQGAKGGYTYALP